MGDRAEVKVVMGNKGCGSRVSQYEVAVYRTIKAKDFTRTDTICNVKKESKCKKNDCEHIHFHYDLPMADNNHYKKPNLRYPDEDR